LRFRGQEVDIKDFLRPQSYRAIDLVHFGRSVSLFPFVLCQRVY
jgi:hypothetical protein